MGSKQVETNDENKQRYLAESLTTQVILDRKIYDRGINQRTFRTTSEPSHEQVTNFDNYLIDTIKNVDSKLICQWIWNPKLTSNLRS